MEELHVADDQSHYEISLTAGQAFAAFVLLLLSLAAAFAFGLMIGKGQADDRLVVQKETPVVTEAALTPKKSAGEIVELGVASSDFEVEAADPAQPNGSPDETADAVAAEAAANAAGDAPPTIIEPVVPRAAQPAPAATAASHTSPAATGSPTSAGSARVVTYAQLLSTGDQRTAENLAARLIDRGFTTGYVERGSTDKGPIYRVRVKFDSADAARAAEPKLREFSRDVWITSK